MGEGRIAHDHLALWARLAKPRHGVGHDLDMVGQQRQKARAQGGQGFRKGRRLRGDIAIDFSAHSAAFIWKPSSILSEGATG